MRSPYFHGRVAVVAALAVATLCLFLPDLAHAQAVGGGGGQLNAIIQWVVTNIVRVMISAGIILVALTLLAARFNYVIVLFIAGGGLVAANYQSIAAMFPV